MLTICVCLSTRGDDYKTHIKCISEDQKYGGKGYEAKTNKGDVKQQQWIQVRFREEKEKLCKAFGSLRKANCSAFVLLLKKVHEAMNKPGVSAKLRDVLQQVSTYDNVPRKKAKFQVSIT